MKHRTLLLEEHAVKRLKWAEEHINWAEEDWKRVRWSDECSIERGSGVRQGWVFRRPGEGLERWAVQGKPLFTRFSQMFWACFGFDIRSDLVVMEGDPDSKRGGVTSKVYIKVLDEYLFTVLDHDSIFMQDNSRIHTAKKVQAWFEQHDVELMEWPPYSPDLNPIENVWAMLKDAIYRSHPELLVMTGEKTITKLIEAAIEAWDGLGAEILDKMSISMKKRCQAVLDADGWYTKY